MIGCLPTKALAVFVYATHATQAIAFEWKPGFSSAAAAAQQQVLQHERLSQAQP